MKIEDVLEWKQRKLEILKVNPDVNHNLIESESIVIAALKAYAEHDRLQKAYALACRMISDEIDCPLEIMGIEKPECKMNCIGPRRQWECWQKYFRERVDAEPVCRVCGCTQNNACPGGCSWTEEDLCSSCAEAGKENGGKE